MKITDKMSRAAVLEQLAEECAELGQAALKLARILRKENPTPTKEPDAVEHFREEVADVRVVLNVIENEITGYLATPYLEQQKLERWISRLRDEEAATQRQNDVVSKTTKKIIVCRVKRFEQNP